jgi:tetratricopeptide (TPR) repeat protein
VTARTPQRNEALRALIEEANWTNHNFASSVNRVAAETGVVLHYDRTAVSHWLSGSCPRPSVRAIIAEALSRRLRRPVLVSDTGLGDTCGVPLPSVGGVTGVVAVLQLAKADLDPTKRTVLRTLPYCLDRTVLSGPSDPQPAGTSPAHVNGVHLDAIRTMTTAFAAADALFGGGHARSALTAYLATDVVPWLQAHAARDMGRQLLSAIATLTHLNGFMCFDNLHHGLAQRYYQVAQRLALEADDPTTHATVLRVMSMQAGFLGYHQHAISLAECAVTQAGTATAPAVRAAVLAQTAVAHAAASHRHEALSYLRAAEKCIFGATAASVNGDAADLAHYTGRVLADLGDLTGAEDALRQSLRLRPDTERRSRMLTIHRLAGVQLRRGLLDDACANWRHFLADYPSVHSARTECALFAMRMQLLPHARNTIVRTILQQVHRACPIFPPRPGLDSAEHQRPAQRW